MLYWSSKMYLDADISVKKKRYQKLLEKNKPTRPLYCITLPVNGENIMEIYSSVPGGGVPMAVIILGVFKWIGIILLCILGLMLLLCLAVLLIPIRYQLSAVWQEEHRVKGSVSWLLHLIHLSFDTDRNQRVCIRIFGIPVNGRFHTKKKKFQKRRKVKQKRKASGSTKVPERIRIPCKGRFLTKLPI